MGPRGGFCQFVFKQLYEKGQFSELLRLGEEFQEELSIFLKQHRNLSWLHEVFLHQFTSASETLHELALSVNDDSISAVEDKEEYHVNPAPTLADRKRLLYLAKISAMAGMVAFSLLLCLLALLTLLILFSLPYFFLVTLQGGKEVDSEANVKRIEADTKILKLQVCVF